MAEARLSVHDWNTSSDQSVSLLQFCTMHQVLKCDLHSQTGSNSSLLFCDWRVLMVIIYALSSYLINCWICLPLFDDFFRRLYIMNEHQHVLLAISSPSLWQTGLFLSFCIILLIRYYLSHPSLLTIRTKMSFRCIVNYCKIKMDSLTKLYIVSTDFISRVFWLILAGLLESELHIDYFLVCVVSVCT